MGKTRVRIEMDDEQKILLKRSLNKNGEGQKFFTHEVRRLCVPYVPNLTGTLQQTAVEHTTHITYGQPYARRQYYENSGKNRSKAPLAGKEWDKRMSIQEIHRFRKKHSMCLKMKRQFFL